LCGGGRVCLKRDAIGGLRDRITVDEDKYALKGMHENDHPQQPQRDLRTGISIINGLGKKLVEHDSSFRADKLMHSGCIRKIVAEGFAGAPRPHYGVAPNARIDAAGNIERGIQVLRMKAKLFPLRLNELLCPPQHGRGLLASQSFRNLFSTFQIVIDFSLTEISNHLFFASDRS
jgi:hypothetical protein